jgi:putative transposase
VKFGFIQTEKATYSVRVLCRTLQVSASGFYAWCRRGLSSRAREDALLKVEIRAAHAASHRTYGSPRILADLKANGQRVGAGRYAPRQHASASARASRLSVFTRRLRCAYIGA